MIISARCCWHSTTEINKYHSPGQSPTRKGYAWESTCIFLAVLYLDRDTYGVRYYRLHQTTKWGGHLPTTALVNDGPMNMSMTCKSELVSVCLNERSEPLLCPPPPHPPIEYPREQFYKNTILIKLGIHFNLYSVMLDANPKIIKRHCRILNLVFLPNGLENVWGLKFVCMLLLYIQFT